VEITDDTIPENSENFFLDLAPPPGETQEHVTISPSQATVTIEDDECEFSSDTATPHNALTPYVWHHTTWREVFSILQELYLGRFHHCALL